MTFISSKFVVCERLCGDLHEMERGRCHRKQIREKIFLGFALTLSHEEELEDVRDVNSSKCHVSSRFVVCDSSVFAGIFIRSKDKTVTENKHVENSLSEANH